jgi:RNA polymerase sigma factor (sigma-70 family)
MNGTDLLVEFRENRSETAFNELVRRYTNLVYSVAQRRLTNETLAQEAIQIVFIRLAKAVPKLGGEGELLAWLHRTTVHVSIDLWRSEVRRQARENQAALMQPDPTENAAWNELAPLLDEALNEMDEADRQAILLRFFDQKTMRDLGLAIGVSEDAAKMRVSRALDRLRHILSARGVSCGALALGTLLTERSVEAAPSELASALTKLKWSTLSGASASTGLLALLLQFSPAKLATGLAAIVLASIAIMVLSSRNPSVQMAATNASLSVTSNADSEQFATALALTNSNAQAVAATDYRPNPRQLLEGVARARKRTASGSMEFLIYSYIQNRGENRTNQVPIKVVFDGEMRRFDSRVREYAYPYSENENNSQTIDAKMREHGWDNEAAVRAGLLEGFEAHSVAIYDGSALIIYREKDGKPESTTIDDPAKGSSAYVFDPRCLGLTASLGIKATIESWIQHIREAKSVILIGREALEGFPTWHVRVHLLNGSATDYWLDTSHPHRVIKYASNEETAISKFDGTSDGDAIPSEVVMIDQRNSVSRFDRRIIRFNTQVNVQVDPSTWTLAGLGMKVGTDVVDVRHHRRIGYWTGTGLSESLPSQTVKSPAPPDRAALMATLEYDPASLSALEAATWIIRNNHDGPEVEKAAEVILNDHIDRTNLVSLCPELERLRHGCSKRLLAAILERNPHPEVQAYACFSLATLCKDEAKFGENQPAATEAEKLFQRVIADFGQVTWQGNSLSHRAQPELSEMRRLFIGKPAPNIEAQDLNGQTLKLSDYRGRVVVLGFWSGGPDSTYDVLQFNKVAVRLQGKPVAILGVNCNEHREAAQSVIEKYEITWPSFWDGSDGPIAAAWNLHRWPTTYVIDAQGVIRHRNLRGSELINAVNALLGR